MVRLAPLGAGRLILGLTIYVSFCYKPRMQHDATARSCPASPPDPQPDRPGKPVPANIAQILHILRVLLRYGDHLVATLEHRAAARGFSTIAQWFGTANVAVILAHLCRGIRRAVALERVLLARAARGRDLVVAQPRAGGAGSQPQPEDQAGTAQAAASEPDAPRTAKLRSLRTNPHEPLDLSHIPTVEELEAEARRRSVGRVIADICRDLGVAPGLCAGGFWNDLFHALISYSGNLAGFCGEMRRREVVFEKELDKRPALGWPEQGREAVRRVLGFFIGEELVDPYAGMAMAGVPGAAAAASRPP